MEALLFMIDSLIIVILVIQGLKDDRRAPGAPAIGFFRMRDDAAEEQEPKMVPIVRSNFVGGDTL